MTASSIFAIIKFDEILFTWLAGNIPILFVVALWLTWKAAWLIQNYRHRFVKVESDTSTLDERVTKIHVDLTEVKGTLARLENDVAGLASTVAGLVKTVAGLSSTVTGLSSTVTGLVSTVAGLSNTVAGLSSTVTGLVSTVAGLSSTVAMLVNANHSAQNRSPTTITDFGYKLLDDMGGRSYIDTNLNELISLMEKTEFKSGLDVQNSSYILLFERRLDDGLVPVRNFVYRNPTYTIDELTMELNLFNALTLMGLYLRDRYFEKYPQLK